MHLPKPQKIQSKFVAGLVGAFLLIGVVCTLGFHAHVRSVLEEEVQDKARLIFMHVDSVQHYVRDVLRPAMYERLPSAFVIQAMSSSYVSRKIMLPVNDNRDGTIYRRVAIDARNPEYEATPFERELIERFRREPERQLYQGMHLINDEKYYLMVRPVRFTRDCLYCHGRPEAAPAELIRLYGGRGFGKEEDAIAGVDFVGISVHRSIGRVENTIFTYFALFALSVLTFFLVANLLFRVLVVNNLKRLNAVFRRNIHDVQGTNLLNRLEQGDEIEELVEGMEQMSEHLFAARGQLQNYAENLRQMVDERTEALSGEVEARRADVRLFVQLLAATFRSRSRAELWRRTLPQICSRFRARRIAYVCAMGPQSAHIWPEGEPMVELPADYVAILTGSGCVRVDQRIHVPVASSTGSAEGLLVLDWESAEEACRHDTDVLQALGRQLGIAAENLSAIDSLFRQMNILQTIVEGITDPLVLMDSGCTVLNANRAARQLTAELSRGERIDGNVLALFFDLSGAECPMRETISRGLPDQREVSLAGERTFGLFLYPVCSPDGSTGQVVVYLRETTLEKRMRQQVWQSEKLATVGKLTAGLAHEMNNPLGVILCYTGLLRQAVTDPEQATDLEVIERHTRQAQRVLRDLLDFARPKGAGSGTADGAAVARSVTEVFAVQAAARGVEVALDCPDGPLPVRLGQDELEQVLSNLLLNALDAAPGGSGRIRVRVTAACNGRVAIEVADNGPGVAAGEEARIFDPFYSTKEPGQGTGLGLAIVYGLVTEVGGRVEAGRSEALGGARFTVLLPGAEACAEREVQA